MPKLVFVTVGVSAIENCLPAFPSPKRDAPRLEQVACFLHDFLEEGKKALLNVQPQNDEEHNRSLMHRLRYGLQRFERDIDNLTSMLAHSRSVSAEIASLLMLTREPGIGVFAKGDEVYLMPSATDIGKVCAEANRIALQERFPDAKFKVTESIAGISFAGVPRENLIDQFEEQGLDSLDKIIREKAKRFIGQHGPTPPNMRLMDVTGGFKGLLLFAPILCKRYFHRLYYFYQEACAPIHLDESYFTIRWADDTLSLKKNIPDPPPPEP